MPKEYSRTDRFADAIQRALATLLLEEIQDARLRTVTISRVNVSVDLAHAKIFVTCLEEDKSKRTLILKALQKAASFLRYRLAHTVELRTTPQLRFYYDDSLEQSRHLSALIDRVAQEDKKRQEGDN